METAEILQLLKQVADQYIRPRFRALGEADIALKGPGDYVTVADREAEAAITAALAAAYPEARIIGEEATAADPALIDGLLDFPHAFVVDPVDGTRNFVQSKPDYAVMVAELKSGVTTRSWIWAPEHGIALTAERGHGVMRNGIPLSPVLRAARPSGTATQAKFLGLVSERLAAPIGSSSSSAGIDYCHLLDGRIDFACFRPPKPWDHLPGSLMVREQTGVAKLVDGSQYDGSWMIANLVVAASADTYQAVRELLLTKL